MTSRQFTHCPICGGEKDAEGWCAHYCTDSDFNLRCEGCGKKRPDVTRRPGLGKTLCHDCVIKIIQEQK